MVGLPPIYLRKGSWHDRNTRALGLSRSLPWR